MMGDTMMGDKGRKAVAAGLAALSVLALTNVVNARPRHKTMIAHRHHVARAIPHRFVFPTPRDARENVEAAEIFTNGQAGDFGIDSATTADPYQRPAVGYDLTGRYGPGYLYPN